MQFKNFVISLHENKINQSYLQQDWTFFTKMKLNNVKSVVYGRQVHLRVQVECDTCGKTMGAGSLAAHVRAVHRNQPYGRRKRDRPGKHVRVPES